MAYGAPKSTLSLVRNTLWADVGGALRLGGTTAIQNCSFISNMASSRVLASATVGSVNISGSVFDGNVFYCEAGKFLEFLDEVRQRLPKSLQIPIITY